MLRSRTLLISFIVHAGVAAALLFAAERKNARRATAIAVVSEEKKKEKPKEDKPPPPPPKVEKPKPRPAKVAEPTPQPPPMATAPPPSAAKASAPAPMDTGLTLGNPDGPGIDVGGAPGKINPQYPEKTSKKDAPSKRDATPAPRKKEEEKQEEECKEDPTKPEPIAKTDLEYTAAARASGVEGRLVLRVYVGKDGGVSKVDVVKSVDPQLDAAIIAAIMEHWRFKPSTRCGKPIANGIYTLASKFELSD